MTDATSDAGPSSPSAGATRTRMPLTTQAHASFAAASSAGNTSDKYVRLTVILATILFLLGISGHFTVRARVFALNARAKDVVGPALLR